jgi:hypothetical protein
MALSIESRRQTIKFGMEAADIPQTTESSHVEITNEENARHFLRNQEYCSL